MTEEFPGNSLGAKKDTTPKAKVEDDSDAAPSKEKLEKVTVNDAIKRKPPLGRRIKETFLGGDSRGVWEYVAFDVIVPAAKDMLADAVSQGVERLIFGEAKSTSRRGSRGRSSGRHTPYGASYRRGGLTPDPRGGRNMSRQARASHNFEEIVLETRGEADAVLDSLSDRIELYKMATVADLYDLVGVSGTYVDERWGWMDLRDSGITRVRSGYLLELPRPEPVD